MATNSAAVFGSTGLVGSFILSNLLATGPFKPVHTIARRAPKAESPNLNSIVDAETTNWPAALTGLSPAPHAVFSAIGTTRAAAGGIENQWKIDHDLNVEVARAAKQAGVKTFVFISSVGSDGFLASTSPYSKMKKGVETTVRELEFDHGIIVRPGLILGEREQGRFMEGIATAFARGLGFLGLQDKFAQDAEVIARAAIRATQLADEGKAPSKFWVLGQGDIIRLGRTEWAQGEEKK
ncbi:fmp52, mitochondrial [Trichoderma arundinaceum]|uniref:Fmp52, mitochondrial n=1 Tax=Trichoderma arundinaceum TaxID=490622 RepID=A0A395P2Z1_TRIAR|nr:fmp52, mitochondrial [Trichoderma arundinaceum]